MGQHPEPSFSESNPLPVPPFDLHFQRFACASQDLGKLESESESDRQLQHSGWHCTSTRQSLDDASSRATVWVEQLLDPSGLLALAPQDSDVKRDTEEISKRDGSIFSPEDNDMEYVLFSIICCVAKINMKISSSTVKCNDDLSDEIPSTPVQRQRALVSKPRKNCDRKKNRPGPLTKKPKCQKLVTPFASCSAITLLSDSSCSDTSSSRPKCEAKTRSLTTKKCKLKDIKKSVDITGGSSDSEWEYVDEFCSRKKNKDRSEFPYKYRCTLCLNDNKPLPVHLCNTQGDMRRHLQSQRHMKKSFKCENPGCSRIFTRDDSLKRHVKKCNLELE